MPPRSKAPPDPSRQLMIKTKACERLVKEVAYYQKEVGENEEILAKMKEENKDPYDIKKFEEVLGESYMMIPDSESRLKKSLEDLASYVQSPEVQTHETGEWYSKAQELLTAERQRLDRPEDEVQETPVNHLEAGEAF